jgi:RES domain-containing protein
MRVWRIVKEKHAATAFDGEGARLYGGRWNSRGTRLIYTSASLSLAALENLVHLTTPVAFRYVALAVEFHDRLVERADTIALPTDCNEEPPPQTAQEIGDRWVREARSVALELPSVIIPGEFNYLLNPAHPDFKKITMSKPELFSFDQRLL